MTFRTAVLMSLVSAGAAFAQQPPQPPAPPRPPNAPMPPMPPPPHGGFMGGGGTIGIPPQIAAKVGISQDTVKKVRDLSFEATEALITLEADLKRAQLELEKTLTGSQADEAAVMNKLELVSRAELAVRKNRLGLLVRIRKLLGPDAWEKLQAEMPGPGPGMMMMLPPPGGVRREVRVINSNGGETIDVQE